MPKNINREYGVNFADVCVSLNQALNEAGGISRTVEGMLSMSMKDLFHDMACNGIRFIHQPREIYNDEKEL